MSKMIENEDGTIQIHYTDKDFTADLPEAGASAERISSVMQSADKSRLIRKIGELTPLEMERINKCIRISLGV